MTLSRAVVASAAAITLTTTMTVAGLAAGPASGQGGSGHHHADRHPTVRFQTFNASLNRARAGELVEDLSTPDDPQAAAVAEIIQRTRPDVLLLNEFDYVPGRAAVDLFRDNYLEVGHGGARPIHYPYAFVAPSNTGVPSGHDLDNSGTVGG
ncbi:MAG: endonuclease/exonuclease/phosphatase family protein, partial [Nocardioides sp.]